MKQNPVIFQFFDEDIFHECLENPCWIVPPKRSWLFFQLKRCLVMFVNEVLRQCKWEYPPWNEHVATETQWLQEDFPFGARPTSRGKLLVAGMVCLKITQKHWKVKIIFSPNLHDFGFKMWISQGVTADFWLKKSTLLIGYMRLIHPYLFSSAWPAWPSWKFQARPKNGSCKQPMNAARRRGNPRFWPPKRWPFNRTLFVLEYINYIILLYHIELCYMML